MRPARRRPIAWPLVLSALLLTGCDESFVGPTPLRAPTSTETGVTRRPAHIWTVFSMTPIGTLDDWRARCHAAGGIYWGTVEYPGGGIHFRVCRLWGEYRVWPGGVEWAEFLGYWDFE
jgi:hypothetical protein